MSLKCSAFFTLSRLLEVLQDSIFQVHQQQHRKQTLSHHREHTRHVNRNPTKRHWSSKRNDLLKPEEAFQVWQGLRSHKAGFYGALIMYTLSPRKVPPYRKQKSHAAQWRRKSRYPNCSWIERLTRSPLQSNYQRLRWVSMDLLQWTLTISAIFASPSSFKKSSQEDINGTTSDTGIFLLFGMREWIVIEDAKPNMRYKLTKCQTQEEVSHIIWLSTCFMLCADVGGPIR